MQHTSIEWALNPDGTPGFTWNPLTGCLNGCDYCYARKLANGRLKSMYLANNILPTHDEPDHEAHHSDPFYPRFWRERFELGRDFLFSSQWRRYTSPVGVFVCDMSDLFGTGVPEDWTNEVLQVIREASCHSSHRFYLLTKQPRNLRKFSPFPDNAWVGVSATDRLMWFNSIWHLQDVKAKVKYISFEPLLNWQHLDKEPVDTVSFTADWFNRVAASWVIIGAQTKPLKLPRYEWAVEIAQACDKAGIPLFIKNNMNSCEISDYPELLNSKGNLRQEMPNV